MKRALLLCLLLLCRPLHAQEALVLSGGGSRGIAHAGVLFGLAERGYDPDIVVGTSMGAVVGSLYASGLTPEQIRKQMVTMGWRALFEPTPVIVGAERAVRYPLLSIDLDVARFRFSRGLVGQWRVNRALATLLFDANARSRGDFDRLPRRFRSIVADLQTGTAIALDSGDLALAVRASMSVPGFFAPIEWNDRVLVDGGAIANLPTSQARRLNASHIIAVDVARARKEIHSLAPLDVVQRTLELMFAAQPDTAKPDVLILPDIPPGFSSANFPDDPGFLIDLGHEAALRELPPRPDAARSVRARPLAALPDSFSALIVEAPDSALAAFARDAFKEAAPGRYNARAVARAIDDLYESALVEGVWPRVIEQPGRAPALYVLIIGQPSLTVSAAGHYENDRGGRAWGVIERYTGIGPLPAVLSASVRIETLARSASTSIRLHANSRLHAAWAFGAFAAERSVRSFEDNAVRTQDVVRYGGWGGIEFPHLLAKRLASLAVRSDWITIEDGDDGLALGALLRLTSIRGPAAVVGIPSNIEIERRRGAFNYTRAALSVSRTIKLDRWQIAALGDLRYVTDQAPLDVQPNLGDDNMMPGLRWDERRGLVRVAGGFDVAHPLGGGFVRVRLRSGTVSDEIDNVDQRRWITGGQVGAIFPTPFGAFEMTYGSTTRGIDRFDVSIGQRF